MMDQYQYANKTNEITLNDAIGSRTAETKFSENNEENFKIDSEIKDSRCEATSETNVPEDDGDVIESDKIVEKNKTKEDCELNTIRDDNNSGKLEKTQQNCENELGSVEKCLEHSRKPLKNFKDARNAVNCNETGNSSNNNSCNLSGSGLNGEVTRSDSEKIAKIVDKETLLKRFARHRSWQDFFETKKTTDDIIGEHFQRNRSNSDGAAIIKNSNNAEAFPSLPNSVLQEMGLHGDPQKEKSSEILETEQKFTTLSLAFAIDAATIKDRCNRQRRTRDQTEKNLSLEIEKLREKVAFLQPLCVDFESAELLSILFSQVERISRAASEVSTAAERYGAVQHEERLTESVRLMVNYVQALKQQRDSARRQLQCTKKVLQEKPSDPNLNSPSATQKMFQNSSNRKFITRRRASIATTNQSSESTASNKETYFPKLNRRISDLSLRASFLNKNNRPNRLEMGGELLKIREDFSNENSTEPRETVSLSEDVDQSTKNSNNAVEAILSIKTSPSIVFRKINSSKQLLKKKSKEDLELIRENNGVCQIIREKLRLLWKDIRKRLKDHFRHWSENDYLQAFFNICAILCFSISIVTLVKMYLEYEYSKRGIDISSSYFSWLWSSTPPQNSVNVGAKVKRKFH